MIQNRALLKISLLLTVLVLALVAASFFPELVITLILAIILALFLEPPVKFLEYSVGLRRVYAILLVFLVVGGALAFLIVQFGHLAIERLKELYVTSRQFPFDQKLETLSRDLAISLPFIDATSINQKIHDIIQNLLLSLSHTAESLAGFLVNLIIIPFIAFFILADGEAAMKGLIERIPNKYFEMALNVFYKLERELSAYLKGLFLESGIVGTLNALALLILGVPYAIGIGICAGIANVVPYLGPIVGASLAIFVSLIYGGSNALILKIIVATVLIRLIDDFVLQPLCFGKTLKLHPVAVVLILLVGHQLLGIAGMVVSIPVATILRVSAMETYWGLKHYTITA